VTDSSVYFGETTGAPSKGRWAERRIEQLSRALEELNCNCAEHSAYRDSVLRELAQIRGLMPWKGR
jgi:hypothetical protein